MGLNKKDISVKGVYKEGQFVDQVVYAKVV